MAINFRRIYCKYTKCIFITVLIAFFVQILIAIKYFPALNDSFGNNEHIPISKIKHNSNYQINGISARKIDGISDDEDFQSKLKVNNKLASHLRLEELDFKPVCEVTTREAISAIHRAKTQHCKQEIVNKTCLIQQGTFYPKVLPNACTSKKYVYGKHLGCFRDEKKSRLLPSFYGNYASTNSPKACLDICVQGGFSYSGVQYSSECFCGDSRPLPTVQIADNLCNMKCSAEPSMLCGGYFTMNVYETGLTKFSPRTPVASSNSQETVRIIFLLTLNGRAIRQVHRLINTLYRSSHYFYIHVDTRQDYMHRKLTLLEKQFPNIKLAKNRFSTIWGGASLLKMLISAMKDFASLGWKWDFVINLSESDFPIKSLENLESFLAVNKGLNFVKSHGREVQRFIKKQGLDKTFIECDTHMWRIGERKLPRGIVIDGGSDWIALSPKFVAYVADKGDDLLNGLDIIFAHTLLPAESFFHTALRNSIFCDTYVDNNLHVTNWKRKLGCKCQYKHVVDWCGCSPNDFRTEDWPRIQNTQDRQLFFARKFEPIINQEVITRVERYIGYHDHHLIHNLQGYWQSMYDFEDLTASTDDVFLTHAASIIRHNIKILQEQNCKVIAGEIIEITTFHYADVYKGNLIHYRALVNGEDVTIETWYKPTKVLDLNLESQYPDNIKNFRVSSDYDQKETMFRNLAGILGPLSEPVLLYQFSLYNDMHVDNYTIIWLDPAGMIANINVIQVNENNLTNFVKPNIKAPILPGIWKVGLFEKSNLLALTKFLVTPLEYFSGKDLTHQEATIIHSGSQSSYRNFTNVRPPKFLPNHEESLLLQKIANSNVKRIRHDLQEWIDNLSGEFYSVLGSCLNSVNYHLQCGSYKFNLCNLTDWSSLSPDKKGTIGKLNKETGRLDRS